MEVSARAAKRQEWVRRLQRFAGTDVTVAQFCARERVSVASFYQWRLKLNASNLDQAAARRMPTKPRPDSSTFVPVRITAPAATIRMRLPNGVELWLPPGDASLLTIAIESAARLAGPDVEATSC